VDIATPQDWRAIEWENYTREVTLENGQRVSCVDIGTGSSPALLLVHGLGASWRVWLQNLGVLSADRRVVAVDLPGFGSSAASGGPVDFRAYAATLTSLVEALDLGPFVAVGNSFGGWISAELARTCPDVVGLVLVDAAGMVPTRSELVRLMTMLRTVGRAAPLGVRYREQIAARPRLRRRAFAMMMAHPEDLDRDLALHLLPTSVSPVFAAVLAGATVHLRSSWAADLSQLATPALVLWGAEDRQLPLRHGREWHRLLANSTLEVLPDTGHVPMLERPEAFNALVQKFVAGL
jgi:pimeloyl-ACP methyl ester carboxylesterase